MNGVNKCNVNSRNSCTTTKGQLLARLKQSRTISIRVNWALKRLKTLTNLLAYASRRWSSSLSSFSWYPTAVANSGAFLSLQLQNSSKIAFSCASIALVYLSAMTKSKKVAPLSRKWENSLCLLVLPSLGKIRESWELWSCPMSTHVESKSPEVHLYFPLSKNRIAHSNLLNSSYYKLCCSCSVESLKVVKGSENIPTTTCDHLSPLIRNMRPAVQEPA